jgi:DNA-binding NtrC family response regulator/tetratricopeptide (TPR) repeat protein
MSTPLRVKLLSAHDPFLFVAEHVALYKSPDSFRDATVDLLDACSDAPKRIRDRVHLGIAYAKRAQASEDPERLLADISTVSIGASDDLEVRLITRLIEGVVVLLRQDDATASIFLLEDVERELRFGPYTVLYGMARRWIGLAYSLLGLHRKADAAYHDAVSIFRRYEMPFAYATTLNDLGVLKRKIGQLPASREMLREALRRFESIGATRNAALTIVNLGIVAEFMGEWTDAAKYYQRANQQFALPGPDDRVDALPGVSCLTNIEYLQIRKREFEKARDGLQAILAMKEDPRLPRRIVALAFEFLGELETELGDCSKANEHLTNAFEITKQILPESDVMTEVLRRQAQLLVCERKIADAKHVALKCIRMCHRISDPIELSAASRVLGEVYVAMGLRRKATTCFTLAIRLLKGSHEAQELMRTLLAYGRLLSDEGKLDAAENHLFEAWQLGRRLEANYHRALIAIAFVDLLAPQERFDESTAWLNDASARRDNLVGVERERVSVALMRAASGLQAAITRASVKSAEAIRTICRVYEDARFPIAEIKPDLAYQVAQSVGSDSLWVIGRKGGGFHVPITYNISTNDAKAITRQLDEKQLRTLLGVSSEPRVLTTAQKQTVLASPCRDMDGRPNGYVTCAQFDAIISVSTRQVEILYASAEALSRLIDDEGGQCASQLEGGDEEGTHARHPRGHFKDILTIDPGMIKLIRLAERAAASIAPILLEGETGVGKELFARAIHAASQHRSGPFVAVNAGGMSVPLLESELFGHVKGAFTDARSERVGLVETAREGTLFLDEVGEMAEEVQVKILRLLENGEYRRLGESQARKASVRVISATNRDLLQHIERGRFRRDLYYRVSPVRMTIPPLRMRPRDIQLMVRHFLRDCAAMNGIADRHIEIDVKAMEALELYDWPGNVRELHNEILRAVSLIGKGDVIRFHLLSQSIKDYLQTKKRGDGLLERSVEQYERRLILRALESHDWNRMQTADAIGVPRTTLLAKLKRFNVASK